MRARGRAVQPKPDKLALLAAQPLECVGFVHRDFVLLQSASLKVSISRRAQYVQISRRLDPEEEGAGAWTPSLGPPFMWEEFCKERCKARIESAGGKIAAVLESESRQRPGLWLHRRITLGNDPVVQVTDTVENRSSSTQTLSRQFGGHPRGEGPHTFVAPAKGQMVSASEASRDIGDLGLHDEAEHWPESWVAFCSRKGWSAGILWGMAERIECASWGCRLETQLGSLAPGELKACEPVYLYVGEGDDPNRAGGE